MTYVFYIDNVRKETDHNDEIPWHEISSPNENTPAIQESSSKYKLWCEKGVVANRLNGPALIGSNGNYGFYLNDKLYDNIYDWMKDHPNQDENFKKQMIELWG